MSNPHESNRGDNNAEDGKYSTGARPAQPGATQRAVLKCSDILGTASKRTSHNCYRRVTSVFRRDDQALTSTPFQNATCPAIFAAADLGAEYSHAASLLTIPFTSTS